MSFWTVGTDIHFGPRAVGFQEKFDLMGLEITVMYLEIITENLPH